MPAATTPFAPSIPTEKSAMCIEPPLPWLVPVALPNSSAIIRLTSAPLASVWPWPRCVEVRRSSRGQVRADAGGDRLLTGRQVQRTAHQRRLGGGLEAPRLDAALARDLGGVLEGADARHRPIQGDEAVGVGGVRRRGGGCRRRRAYCSDLRHGYWNRPHMIAEPAPVAVQRAGSTVGRVESRASHIGRDAPMLHALGRHRLADDLGEPQRAGPGGVADRRRSGTARRSARAPSRSGSGFSVPGRELVADLVFGEPGEAVAHARRLDRRRHVADGPALRRRRPTSAARRARRAGVAHDEMAMRAQVAQRELALQRVQRMVRMRDRDARECASAGRRGSPAAPAARSARSACPCSSASPVPPSTDSMSSMRVCGLSAPKRSRHLSSSHVGNRISTAIRISRFPAGRQRARGALRRRPPRRAARGRGGRAAAPSASAPPCGPGSSNAFTPSCDSSFCTA